MRVSLYKQISYYSPVDPSFFGFLSLMLIGSGLSFMALFFVYEMKVRVIACQRPKAMPSKHIATDP
jgi:hypothetical protein